MKKKGTLIIAMIFVTAVIFSACKPGNRIKELKLETAALTMEVGASQKIDLVVQPKDADVTDMQWSTNDPEIAAVDNTGLVVGKKAGSTVITVKSKDGRKSAEIMVTIKEISVKSVELDKNVLTLQSGATSKLQAKITPAYAGNKNIAWESSNAKVVSVDENGNIKAISQGSADITVKTEDGQFIDKCIVTVKSKPYPAVKKQTSGGTKTSSKPKSGITAVIKGNGFDLYENGKFIATYSAYASYGAGRNLQIRCLSIPSGPVIEFRAYAIIDGKRYAAYGETDSSYYYLNLPGSVTPTEGGNPIEVYMTYKDKQFKVMTWIYAGY